MILSTYLTARFIALPVNELDAVPDEKLNELDAVPEPNVKELDPEPLNEWLWPPPPPAA